MPSIPFSSSGSFTYFIILFDFNNFFISINWQDLPTYPACTRYFFFFLLSFLVWEVDLCVLG